MSEPQMELVRAEPQAVARFEDPTVALMEKALACQANPEAIASLMAMRRELRAEAAKEAYDRAMAAFQAECPVIYKKKEVRDPGNNSHLYNYAPIEDVVVIVRPLMQKHGFSFAFDTDTKSDPGWVIARCCVTHSLCGVPGVSGHKEMYEAKFPLGNKTRIMSDTQVYAGTLTFACRRVLCNAFGIVTADEDMDGRMKEENKEQGPSAKETTGADPVMRKLVANLWGILAQVRGDKKNWDAANQWLWRQELLDAAAGESMPNNVSVEKLRAVLEKAGKLIKEGAL